MDYTKEPLIFKIKKVTRYVGMYGLERTLKKVRSQYHMQSKTSFVNEWVNEQGNTDGDVAIIGCGNFAFSTIAHYVSKKTQGKIKYTLDTDSSKSLSLAKEYKAYKATENYEEILNDPGVKVIYIASNHASHAEYAILALECGKDVHIEKPHVVNYEQLVRLEQAMLTYPNSRVFLGFNRPKSKLFKILMGEVEKQPGNIMMNWFIAGHEIDDDHWYFSEAEGGRVMGNLCHWSDLCLHLVGIENAFPCTISPAIATEAKSNFAVTVTFADGSQAALTFSAKGHTFEGVREYLNIHKGDLLASLRDFQDLSLDIIDKQHLKRLRHRDHGHCVNITHSYNAHKNNTSGESLDYVRGSALFVLKIKEALDTNSVIICENKL
ncbi:Gfo/Idh/MocA family protein [Pleionea mediterranea]|uniref:Putative dehydrogenase n=1 Tax=Pleionea mediterranea TaxID=523701 RepID=A0A316FQJ1_9GAMM|nr:Gfo/Idh/MocA family oxidoreductase [Pleionea mediterranea]PWK50879.1 putative dehydrogenase [Pleionea mediterranea]